MAGRNLIVFALVACVASSALSNEEITNNEVFSRTIPRDSLLSDIMSQCFRQINMEAMTCVRVRVLMFLDQFMGVNTGRNRLSELMDDAVPRDEDKARNTNDAALDQMITNRVVRLLRTNVFRVELPETFFQGAVLTYKPTTSDLDFQFPQLPSSSRALDEARGILKKKLLLPVLLLLKLKMKALMPILVLIAKIKAVKALLISKIALLVVVGFVFLQLCKKLGGGAMMPAMMMPAAMDPMMTPAPAPTNSYGAPMPPAPPTNSYGPAETGWEPAPAASSSYSKVWDPHQVAYKSYYASQVVDSATQSQPQTQQ